MMDYKGKALKLKKEKRKWEMERAELMNQISKLKKDQNDEKEIMEELMSQMLSTWMAPLRSSADIRYVGTQKEIYGLRVSQNTIDGLIKNYIYHPSSWLFFTF